MDHVVLSLPMFNYAVVLITNEEGWKDIAPSLSRVDQHWLADSCACVWANGATSVVCLDPTDPQELHTYAGTVAHEATHVFQNMCEYISDDKPSDEFEAYLIGYITGWLLEHTLPLYLEN